MGFWTVSTNEGTVYVWAENGVHAIEQCRAHGYTGDMVATYDKEA